MKTTEIVSNIQKQMSSTTSNENIFRQLERMLSSPHFRASPQQIALLNFVVKQTLAGNIHEIKGYTVATEVFGRGPDFDQSIDPVVSIQAGRLRRAMERYYLTAGKHDPIRIEIPKGTYIPAFCKQISSDRQHGAETGEPLDVMASCPIIWVRPLINLTGNPDDDFVSTGLTAELTHALCHLREIRVLEPQNRSPEFAPSETDIDFFIGGSVRRDPEHVTVTIRLHDAKKGFQIWSGKYVGDLEAARTISFQEDLAAEVAVRVAGGYAEIPRYLAGLNSKQVTPDLSTYDAMLRFWESDILLTPQSMLRAIRALEYAVASEPGYGQTWSMLAAQYADNYLMEIIDLQTPLEKAADFAQRGVSLNPACRRSRMILGYIRYLENKLQEARFEAETAYNLCPNSLVVLDGIGWLMALAGEWERGVKWIKKSINCSPYYRPWVRYPLCLNWFRQGNYEKAYQETQNFMMPEFFWDQIMKASTCGHLGLIEEGRACARALLALKPDFAQRGRILIGRFIKFKDIADRIQEGLDKLGMHID